MKVKLLRKVRKRYKITRIDENSSNVGGVYKSIENDLGLPFFVLEDNRYIGIYTKFFKTFEEARLKLSDWILHDYKEKFRHKDEKSTVVWWSSK